MSLKEFNKNLKLDEAKKLLNDFYLLKKNYTNHIKNIIIKEKYKVFKYNILDYSFNYPLKFNEKNDSLFNIYEIKVYDDVNNNIIFNYLLKIPKKINYKTYINKIDNKIINDKFYLQLKDLLYNINILNYVIKNNDEFEQLNDKNIINIKNTLNNLKSKYDSLKNTYVNLIKEKKVIKNIIISNNNNNNLKLNLIELKIQELEYLNRNLFCKIKNTIDKSDIKLLLQTYIMNKKIINDLIYNREYNKGDSISYKYNSVNLLGTILNKLPNNEYLVSNNENDNKYTIERINIINKELTKNIKASNNINTDYLSITEILKNLSAENLYRINDEIIYNSNSLLTNGKIIGFNENKYIINVNSQKIDAEFNTISYKPIEAYYNIKLNFEGKNQYKQLKGKIPIVYIETKKTINVLDINRLKILNIDIYDKKKYGENKSLFIICSNSNDHNNAGKDINEILTIYDQLSDKFNELNIISKKYQWRKILSNNWIHPKKIPIIINDKKFSSIQHYLFYINLIKLKPNLKDGSSFKVFSDKFLFNKEFSNMNNADLEKAFYINVNIDKNTLKLNPNYSKELKIALFAKFIQNEIYKNILKETKDALLIESINIEANEYAILYELMDVRKYIISNKILENYSNYLKDKEQLEKILTEESFKKIPVSLPIPLDKISITHIDSDTEIETEGRDDSTINWLHETGEPQSAIIGSEVYDDIFGRGILQNKLNGNLVIRLENGSQISRIEGNVRSKMYQDTKKATIDSLKVSLSENLADKQILILKQYGLYNHSMSDDEIEKALIHLTKLDNSKIKKERDLLEKYLKTIKNKEGHLTPKQIIDMPPNGDCLYYSIVEALINIDRDKFIILDPENNEDLIECIFSKIKEFKNIKLEDNYYALKYTIAVKELRILIAHILKLNLNTNSVKDSPLDIIKTNILLSNDSIDDYLIRLENYASMDENELIKGDWGGILELRIISYIFNVNIKIYNILNKKPITILAKDQHIFTKGNFIYKMHQPIDIELAFYSKHYVLLENYIAKDLGLNINKYTKINCYLYLVNYYEIDYPVILTEYNTENMSDLIIFLGFYEYKTGKILNLNIDSVIDSKKDIFTKEINELIHKTYLANTPEKKINYFIDLDKLIYTNQGEVIGKWLENNIVIKY